MAAPWGSCTSAVLADSAESAKKESSNKRLKRAVKTAARRN